MEKKKTLLLTVKILIAAALMWWVLSGVAMRSYVISSVDGEKIPAKTLFVKSGGDFQLITPEDSSRDYPSGSFTPVSSDGGISADNFLRPGLLDVIESMDFLPVVLAMLLLALSYCVGAMRWCGLVNSAGLKLGRFEAFRLTWLGLFFNNVVLGTTGGDIAKVFALSRKGCSRTESLLTVMADRIFGLFSLVLLAGVSVGVMFLSGSAGSLGEGFYYRLKLAGLVIAAAFAAIAIATVLVLRLSGHKPIPAWLNSLLVRFSMDQRFALAAKLFGLYSKNRPVIPVAILRSLMMQMLFITAIWQFSVSIGLDIAFSRFVLFIPLIYMIAAVPVTPGAVGVIEGLYAGMFAGLAGRSELLILAVLVRLAILVCSLPGVAALGAAGKRE